jgi:very-short-patch-repair endonuclease
MAKIKFDQEDQVERVYFSMLETLKGSIRYDVFLLSKICESPIEVALGASILAHDRLDQFTKGNRIALTSTRDIKGFAEDVWLMVPQYEFEGYRIDLAMRVPRYRFQWVFIECDGHNFHERTKEQAANDRQKDRVIQASGFPILRFTGSEIHRDPGACGNAFFDFLDQRIDDWIPQGGL